MKEEIKQRIQLIKNGEVPQGYKKTKVGIVPIDWKIKKLKEIADIYDGTHKTPNYTKEGVKFISVEDIRDIDKSSKFISEVDFEKNFKIKPQFNDIFMTRIGDIGTSFIIKSHNKYAFYVSLSLIRCSNNLNSDFLNQAIQGYNLQKELYSKTIHVAFPKKINLGDIGHCLINLIGLKEQQKISDILTTQDKIIKLIEEKEKQKNYLMQNLITGKIRLKGFNDKWEKVKLKTILEETKEKNKNLSFNNVLSISNKLGFLKQKEQFGRTVASKDLSKYKIIKNGYIGYNPSRINVGSIATYNKIEEGIVSPMYIVLKTKEQLLNKFFMYFTDTNYFLKKMKNLLTGSVRDSLNFKDLCQMKINLPSLQEQNAIVNILSKADEEIQLLQKDLEQEKQKKKALMQLLLTGIIRV